jgi:hypothetical protein
MNEWVVRGGHGSNGKRGDVHEEHQHALENNIVITIWPSQRQDQKHSHVHLSTQMHDAIGHVGEIWHVHEKDH